MTRAARFQLHAVVSRLSPRESLLALTACFNLLAVAAHGEVTLTFDDDGTVTNSELINQDYGDRVITSPDGNGLLYNVVGDGAPNVVAAYGGTSIGSPELWTTGYGDLTNVLYNEIDGDTLLQVTLTADPGFQVGLLSFESAAFGSGETVPGIQVVDGQGGILFSLGATFIGGGQTRSHFDFGAGLFGSEINLNIDLTGLGGASDNVGLDNIRFTQRAIPEPSAATLLLSFGFLVPARQAR